MAKEEKKEAPKKEKYELLAEFKTFDEDGDKVVNKETSEGETVEDALKGLNVPDGLNVPVKLTAKKGSREISRRLAQHTVRAIIMEKDAYEFERLYNGL